MLQEVEWTVFVLAWQDARTWWDDDCCLQTCIALDKCAKRTTWTISSNVYLNMFKLGLLSGILVFKSSAIYTWQISFTHSHLLQCHLLGSHNCCSLVSSMQSFQLLTFQIPSSLFRCLQSLNEVEKWSLWLSTFSFCWMFSLELRDAGADFGLGILLVLASWRTTSYCSPPSPVLISTGLECSASVFTNILERMFFLGGVERIWMFFRSIYLVQ